MIDFPPDGDTGPFFEANREVLDNGPMGDTAVAAYEGAVALDPRLGMVEVEESSLRRAGAFARAIPTWDDSRRWNPNHRVELYWHDTAIGVHAAVIALRHNIEAVPGASAYFTERMALDEEAAMSIEGLYAFGLLREFGRAGDFMNYQGRQREYIETEIADRQGLPVPNMSVSRMMGSVTQQGLQKRWEELSERLDVATMDELIEKQFLAFRAMTFEAYADNFAESVIRNTPGMF
jgi:hypothetical protein